MTLLPVHVCYITLYCTVFWVWSTNVMLWIIHNFTWFANKLQSCRLAVSTLYRPCLLFFDKIAFTNVLNVVLSVYYIWITNSFNKLCNLRGIYLCSLFLNWASFQFPFHRSHFHFVYFFVSEHFSSGFSFRQLEKQPLASSGWGRQMRWGGWAAISRCCWPRHAHLSVCSDMCA